MDLKRIMFQQENTTWHTSRGTITLMKGKIHDILLFLHARDPKQAGQLPTILVFQEHLTLLDYFYGVPFIVIGLCEQTINSRGLENLNKAKYSWS